MTAPAGVEYEGIEELESPLGLSSSVVINELAKSGKWVHIENVITNGDVRWLPDLCSVDERTVLHVHLAEELRPHMRKRLQMALSIDRRVVVALRLQSLYHGEIVDFLGGVGADVVLVDAYEGRPLCEPMHVLTVLSELSVPVGYEVRTRIARRAWDDRALGSSSQKGRRFEGLLAFLLGQVGDFRVVERNYRGDTDEIDLILQIDTWSKRCWHKSGMPFLLVEAKNWADAVGQSELTLFRGKLKTRHQTTRIGLLFAASRFTSDAREQETKFALDPQIVVMIDGAQMEKWIDSADPDELLEKMVRHAMLR